MTATRIAACAALVVAACAGRDEIVADAAVTADAATADAATACVPACGPCQRCAAGACVALGDPVASQRLALGWNHSLSVAPSGEVWAWGANGSGQLGVGDRDDRARATRVPDSAGPWRSLAGGSRHTCGVRADGSLWCWGVNVHGQLGVGDTDDRSAPTRVGADADWQEVVCGGLHTCARRDDGAVWCWGANPVGQLGLGAPTEDQWLPQQVGSDHDVTALAARARHTCALRSDGSLWCWGDNSDGQLGVGDTDNRFGPVRVGDGTDWRSLVAGALHTCAVDGADQLHCWGDNASGQLGLGDTDDRTTPAAVGAPASYAALAGGFGHTCALNAGGELRCWGGNGDGQLGLGDTDARLAPVAVAGVWAQVAAGADHTCARDDVGAVRCWGANDWGQLGADTHAPAAEPGAVCWDASER